MTLGLNLATSFTLISMCMLTVMAILMAYGPSNTLAQAANSTIFQEMAPLLMFTYSTMEGCPLHMVSAIKMALKF